MTLDQKKICTTLFEFRSFHKKGKNSGNNTESAAALTICNLQSVRDHFYYNYNSYNDEVLSSGHGEQFLRGAFYAAGNL